MNDRSKKERLKMAWAYKGNAQVFEVKLGQISLEHLKHPNRVMEQHRSSNKSRKVA